MNTANTESPAAMLEWLRKLDSERTQDEWHPQRHGSDPLPWGIVSRSYSGSMKQKICTISKIDGQPDARFIAAAPSMMRLLEHQQRVIERMEAGFKEAVGELVELIDGGEECFGRDSALSRIIGSNRTKVRKVS